MAMSAAEIEKLSTPEERRAEAHYKVSQLEAADNGGRMGETALLEASQTIGILVARNKRLGLVK